MGIIVLAGGYGKKFQTSGGWVDKLLIKLDGTPLLLRTVKNLESIGEEMVVATKPNRVDVYSRLLRGIAKVVPDDPPTFKACILAGVNAGLKKLENELFTIVAGDMPFIKPRVIELLQGRASSAAVPVWPNGIVEPLLSVYKRDVLKMIPKILGIKDQIRATDLIRSSANVNLVSINEIVKVDKELSSLISINSLTDLRRRRLRISGSIESKELKGHSQAFWNALDSCSKGEWHFAMYFFNMEAEIYDSLNLSLLKKHAICDAKLCEKKVKRGTDKV